MKRLSPRGDPSIPNFPLDFFNAFISTQTFPASNLNYNSTITVITGSFGTFSVLASRYNDVHNFFENIPSMCLKNAGTNNFIINTKGCIYTSDIIITISISLIVQFRFIISISFPFQFS